MKGLIECVAVGVDVGHVVPVALVFQMETHGPYGTGIGHGATDGQWIHAGAQFLLHLLKDGDEIVSEQDLCEGGNIQLLGIGLLIGLPDVVDTGDDFFQGGYRILPAGGLLMACSTDQINDDGAQNFVRPLSLNILEGLEHLIGKVEGMTVAGEVEIGGGAENKISQHRHRFATIMQSQQDALGGASITQVDVATEPAFHRRQIGIDGGTREGEPLAPGAAGGSVGDLRQTVYEEQIVILRIHVIPEVGTQRQDGDTRGPAIVGFVGAVEQPVLDDLLRRGARLPQGRHRLGDEERGTVLQALFEGALAPIHQALSCRLFGALGNADEQHAVPCLDGETGDVVAIRQKTAPRLQVEFPVVPVADEDAVPDAALRQGVAHMGAPIVAGIEPLFVTKYGEMIAIDGEGFALIGADVGGGAQLMEHHVVGINGGCCWWSLVVIVIGGRRS